MVLMSETVAHVHRTERFDLNALYETSRLLSASLDLEFVLNNLLLTAMSKLLVTRGAVMLYDPVESGYRVASSKGLTGLVTGDLHRLQVPTGDHMLMGTDVPEELSRHRIALVIPVRSGHRDIGLIVLGAKATRQPFERRELEFISSLVNMSSAAVHNSLMVQELKQANHDLDAKIQQLNTLFDLSKAFNAVISRERLVKLLSFSLMGHTLVSKYLFLLRTTVGQPAGLEDGDELFQVVTAKGISNPILEPDLARALCERQEMILLQDEADAAPEWEGLRTRGIHLVLPLQQNEETCAVLCLGPKMTGQPYQPDDIDFLYALGNLAFVSLQNTYLVEEQIEKKRLEEEMRLARDIQLRLLPQEIPAFEDVDAAALAIPSREVGGDYFDFSPLDSRRLLLAIADVTGKGLPAALLMANLQASLHVLFPLHMTIEEAASHINRVVCENTSYDKFITYFHAIFHRDQRTLEYVNAGHNPPILLRANGNVEYLERGGLLLGVMKYLTYERGHVELEPGDLLVLFTDGVTEAMGDDGEEYGDDRFLDVLRAHRLEPTRDILDAVHRDIRRFTGDTSRLSDDLTMVALKLK